MPKMHSTPHIDQIPGTWKPEQLVAWRKSHGFSQADAGNLLGISRRTYQHYEKGDTRGGFSLPTLPRLVELAIKGLDGELRYLRRGGLKVGA
jgi:transcriptional regulator with XRE-family HTH domain